MPLPNDDRRGILGRRLALFLFSGFPYGESAGESQMTLSPGAKSAAVTVAGVQGSSSSGFPRLVRHGNELVFAWTESTQGAGESDSVLTVHTAVAYLPQ